MSRSVYFAFDYQDVISFRANVVRNSWLMNKYKFKDSSIWEEAKEKKVDKIKALIDNSLKGISVTCVLTGTDTFNRRYVRYEIVKSFVERKGLLSVRINWIKDKKGNIKFWPGENPFHYLKLHISKDGTKINFLEYKNDNWLPYTDLVSFPNDRFKENDWNKTYRFDHFFHSYSYDWDNGKNNLINWIEKAANDVGR